MYLLSLLLIGGLVGGMAIYKNVTKDNVSPDIEAEETIPINREIPKVTEKDMLEVNAISENVKEKALKKTKGFLSAYVSYDEKKPLQYVREMKPYVIQDYWEEHYKHPKRESLNLEKRTFNEGETTFTFIERINDDFNQFGEPIVLSVELNRTSVYREAEPITETVQYWVEVENIDDEWLVSGVNIEHVEKH